MKRWLARVGIALGVLLVLLLGYGVLVEPRLVLDEERAEVPIPQLGEELAGTEVGVVSDFQLGMWFANTGMVARAVETLVAAEPDAVLLGGDFLYSTDPSVDTQIDTLLDLLDPLLDSGIPAYAVLGNHDHAVGAAEELTTALEDAGIPVLVNEVAAVPGPVEDPARQLHVVGIGAETAGRADVDAALAGLPEDAPRVVLTHNPTVFDRLPAGSAPLTLAGHTHCGQVTLPGSPRWSYLALTAEERMVADGWAPEGFGAEGNRLFVTCGIGFSLAPVRINAPPQVAFFELQPGG
ncbi:metallophosphoesterase [Geodermatophilus sp. DSM 44513]|uniref:metallophosphoesterase n=1 Tax=Geodermatophilus sp. DSM 44513 TaxID=1528104 RepID=UPI00127DA6E0|nr:metallophosphoesterase [Geodermatophilus sp. DSM 44513]WNV77655.1 metallophosphoesterase [Geodermatophilus sp. DSM 44513]